MTLSKPLTLTRLVVVGAMLALLFALALPLSANATSNVPFKGHEAGGEAQFIGFCDDDPTVVELLGAGTGTATHLGRFHIVYIECFNVISGNFTVEFSITAANGDVLEGTYSGSVTGPTSYSASAELDGGTGRFADADGTATIHGTFGEDGYEQSWHGQLSNPGHSG